MYSFEERKIWCKNVKIAMIAKEITTKQLSQAVDYTPQYVSMIVNGNYYSKEAVERISNALGIRSY